MSAARSSESRHPARAERRRRAFGRATGAMVLHALPIGYSLDANRGVHDPIGMLGETLGVDMHVVTADEAPLSNLELAINRCHLEVETVVATPYASGLAVLVDDEAELGVACIDMGGGTTTLSDLPRRRVRACRRRRRRRPARDARYRARALDQPRRCRAHQGAARIGAAVDLRRQGHPDHPAGRRGRARSSEHRRRARR